MDGAGVRVCVCVVQQLVLLMHTRLVVGSGTSYPFGSFILLASVSCSFVCFALP